MRAGLGVSTAEKSLAGAHSLVVISAHPSRINRRLSTEQAADKLFRLKETGLQSSRGNREFASLPANRPWVGPISRSFFARCGMPQPYSRNS